MSVRNILLASLCIPALSACVVEPGGTTSQPRTIADQCVGRTASALRVNRSDIVVTEALSLPEGDLVTMLVPGTGTVRCTADVDGVIQPLQKIAGPAEVQVPTVAPLAAPPA